MRYYEIATADSIQELDEDLKSKLRKLAHLGAAASTAATLGYGAGVATHPTRYIQQTPASIARDMKGGPDEPAGYTASKSDLAPTTSPRPKPRPMIADPDLAPTTSPRPRPRPAFADPKTDTTVVKAEPEQPVKAVDIDLIDPKLQAAAHILRPEARPWTKDMKSVDPKLQAAADTANEPSMVDNVSSNVDIENMLIQDAKAAGIKGVELQAFLAQASHESDDFVHTEEQGSDRYFRRHYDIRNNPDKAKELGNDLPGDGVKYHGRGYLQITGKYNYAEAGKALDLPLLAQPELLEDPINASRASIWYWKWRVRPNVRNMYDVEDVTSQINPKLKGLEHREDKFNEYKHLRTNR